MSKPKKIGRPLKDIPKLKVEQLAQYGCTNVEIAQFFEVDESTIRKRFSENLTKGRSAGKIRLRQLQIEACERGSVPMLIWMGKQMLGQTDKAEVEWTHDIEDVEFIEV
tara:strand:- start:101 stop:427 length:327 start_codon:yes stop_codon:yes gene_type:complete